MTDEQSTFGAALRRLRAKRGISQAELARRVHYTKSYLSKVETGAKRPTPLLARRCDEALDAAGALADLAGPAPARPRAARPAQLPAPVAGFVGRAAELATLDSALAGPREGGVVCIAGTAGSGKTALALAWANRARERYPDGTLFVNLRGHGPTEPLRPGEALDGFLRALGVAPPQIPTDPEAGSALLRTVLHGRRVLMVLDNAADSTQVRPLLPGAGRCAVVVTSRSRLSGLIARDGATAVALPLLTEAEALALLRLTVGTARVDAEPDVAAALARQCAYLPLALRIAAERAASLPGTPLARLAEQLGAGPGRLDLLAADEDATAVRAVLSWSYRALPAGAARALRLLGLHPGPDLGAGAAAALIGSPRGYAHSIPALVDAHLVERTPAGRLHLHDLLRLYAAERAAQDEPESGRTAAQDRLADWYLHSALAAEERLIPGRGAPGDQLPAGCVPQRFDGYDAALAWYELERVNLVAQVHAAATTRPATAWRLAAAMSGYFLHTKRWTDWIATHEAGLHAARGVGDPAGQARMLSSLGAAHIDQGRYAEALEYLARALPIRRATGERGYEAHIHLNTAVALSALGRHAEALGSLHEAIALFRATGERYGLGSAANNLGYTYLELGRYEEAAAALQESLDAHRLAGDRYGEAMTLDSLGALHRRLGEHGTAMRYLVEALELRREIGDRHGEGLTEGGIGDVLRDGGLLRQARQRWRTALAILDQLGAPQADAIRDRLAGG